MIDAMFVTALQLNFSDSGITKFDENTLLIDGTPYVPTRWVNEIGMYLELTPELQAQVLTDISSDITLFMNK